MKYDLVIINSMPNLVLTNPSTPSRSTLSFVIRHGSSNLYLHHGFVVALLSDLFGIQARTVDAGKHSYARRLFGVDSSNKKFEAVLERCDPGFNIISPGFVQGCNLTDIYFVPESVPEPVPYPV